MSPLSAPHLLAVGCSNMVSLCDIGSHGGCVGLLWAVDAQRGQCSLAVRGAERLATEMLAGPGVRSTCKIKPASTYCLLTSDWCISLDSYEGDLCRICWTLCCWSVHAELHNARCKLAHLYTQMLLQYSPEF